MRMGKSDPALLPPMRIKLDPDKRPVKVKARRYPAPQRAFLKAYTAKLVELGIFVPNPHVEWQAAPLLFPKSGSKATFRCAIDLRPVNTAMIKQAWSMPHLDSEVLDFAGSRCFAFIDFVHGYWQLPLHPDSYTACRVVCPDGAYSSTRVIPCLTNAAAHFQSSVEPLFKELRATLKAYIDDFNIFTGDGETLLRVLRRFMEICRENKLLVSAKKSTFFAKEIKWFGRLVNGDGYTMDPANIAGLRDMHAPERAEELCEFIHCCRWMATAISDFDRRVTPLNDILERAYAKAGKRKKRAIKGMPLLDLPWSRTEAEAFTSIQDSLRDALYLSYPRKGNVICLFTDASNNHWAGVVTQAAPDTLSKPFFNQEHEPLAFLGGTFKDAQSNWSTYEQEGYGIVKTLDKLDYLFLDEHPVHVFTDHRNLLFVFALVVPQPTLGQHVVAEIQRWAVF